MKRTVREGRCMGSPLRLTLAGIREHEADRAWSLVSDVFRSADRELSRWDAKSALSRLNASMGQAVAVPPLLRRALATAWRAFRVTDGRFDPRIIGALEAAGERAGVPLPPSPTVLSPHDRWISVCGARVRLDAPVDLGGIGKGLALRWSTATLRRAGHCDFLLQAGGDVVARGLGPGGQPWTVGLEDPGGAATPLTTIELRDAALATSSIGVRHWFAADGSLRHHLIDPATGSPADPVWLSVTVMAPDPAWAEVASKVGFLAGSGIGSALAGLPAWWVGPDHALVG
ncbi:MAG: FAD:protein FMN transferase [Chloroflexota bacterium]